VLVEKEADVERGEDHFELGEEKLDQAFDFAIDNFSFQWCLKFKSSMEVRR
jgi:hypothetical protein